MDNESLRNTPLPFRIGRLRVQLLAFMLARLVLNTGHRMVYPFLPTFARGLGVDLSTIALAVTARSGLGLISPVFGALADKRGRKVAMISAMVIFASGMILVTAWPTFPALFAGLLLASVAKLIYDPSMQAYIGDRVDYARRGQAIAFTELSWSGAFLLGMPLIGWLIAHYDLWQAPFPVLAALAMISVVALWRAVPFDGSMGGEHPSLTDGIRLVLRHRAAMAGLAVSFLISASNEVVAIVYGAWMEHDFAFKVTALGASAVVIGFAELAGEAGVAGVVDRIGKRRAVALGTAFNAAAALFLPGVGFGVVGAMVGLFVFFITFEFAIVSSLPLMTELMPNARGTLMAGNVAAFAGGRMIGALAGPLLFEWGLLANGMVAALFDALILVVLLVFIPEDR